MHLLIAFLIFLLIVVVVAALVIFILGTLTGVPSWTQNAVLAVAALVVLIWILEHITAIMSALHG